MWTYSLTSFNDYLIHENVITKKSPQSELLSPKFQICDSKNILKFFFICSRDKFGIKVLKLMLRKILIATSRT